MLTFCVSCHSVRRRHCLGLSLHDLRFASPARPRLPATSLVLSPCFLSVSHLGEIRPSEIGGQSHQFLPHGIVQLERQVVILHNCSCDNLPSKQISMAPWTTLSSGGQHGWRNPGITVYIWKHTKAYGLSTYCHDKYFRKVLLKMSHSCGVWHNGSWWLRLPLNR